MKTEVLAPIEAVSFLGDFSSPEKIKPKAGLASKNNSNEKDNSNVHPFDWFISF